MLIIEEVFQNMDENIRIKMLEDIVVHMILNEENFEASNTLICAAFSEKDISKEL